MAAIDPRSRRLLGISEAVDRTWDAALPRDVRVLVPIHVDVLIVREEGIPRADCTFRNDATRSRDALPAPFATAPSRAPGAYLHWSVPDALATIGTSDASPTPTVLPDRWLVARLHLHNDVVQTRAWVLDARTGVAEALDDWLPGAPTGKPLTALGGGDAGWIGYYDNTANRLGFYDALAGLPQGQVSWLVCGWYANPSDDPLATRMARTAEEFDARLTQLGWGLDAVDLDEAHRVSRAAQQRAVAAGKTTPKASRGLGGYAHHVDLPAPMVKGRVAGGLKLGTTVGPTASLFHGSIKRAGWPRPVNAVEIAPPLSPTSVRVVCATTPAEAFATLIGGDSELLTAFAVGATAELPKPDGRVVVADRLHGAGFAGQPTGSDVVTRTGLQTRLPSEREVTRKQPGAKRWNLTGAKKPSRATLVPEATPERKDVFLPRSRRFLPTDPVFAVMGVGRSLRHGGDGVFDPDKRLACRLTGSVVTSLSLLLDDVRVSVTADEVRATRLDHGGLPPECDTLLAELVLLDPGLASAHAERVRAKSLKGSSDLRSIKERVEVEQTAWWAIRRPDSDTAAILAHSGIKGTLPSPLAMRVSTAAWVPAHLDWEVEYLPTHHAAWSLGELDFSAPAVPKGEGTRFTGRTLLSGGAADALGRSLRVVAAQIAASDTSATAPTGTAAAGKALLDAADPEPAALIALADRLAALDVLSGSVEHLHLLLRRDVSPHPADPTPAAPEGFVALRSGFLRVHRLRLVDAFGQYVDLALTTRPVEASPAMAVPANPNLAALPPRFTAPSRLSLRYVDAVTRTLDATPDRAPVVGWLLPDHLDGALEVFEGDGTPKGQLRALPDGSTVWEPAPGLPAAVGESPAETLTHPALRALVSSVHDAGRRDKAVGRESALSALLRVVDTTRWTVDPYGQVGEEHLALLLGHPIVVVAATLRLEVVEPVGLSPAADARVPVRLGALSHWKDGLLAYIVEDDMGRIRVAAAAAELARAVPATGDADTPVDHPSFDRTGIMWVVPNRTYPLLLLMEPHTSVHATTGLLPRKEVGLRREWMAPALGVLAPTFRFGPVLRDPAQVRMPIPADLGGAWTWTHRADVDRWMEEVVVHAGSEALFSAEPATAEEGWLRFTPEKAEGR